MNRDRDRLPGEVRPPGAEVPGDETSEEGPSGGAPPHGEAPGEPEALPDDEAEPIGIFPTWGWVYGTVVTWAAVMIVLLYVFTVTFDYSAR